jgi:hypothetical protein
LGGSASTTEDASTAAIAIDPSFHIVLNFIMIS